MKEIFEANIQIQKSILVCTSASKAFNFHADINNIAKVLPPFIEIKINKLDWPFEAGSRAELVFWLFGFLPLFVWRLKMLEFVPNSFFVDTVEGGFFRHFEHKHEFISANTAEKENQCEIRDTIKLSSGAGRFNRIFDRLILQPLVHLFLLSKLRDTQLLLEN